MRESILKKLTYFYMVPLLLVLGINCVFSLFKTTYFDLYAYSEIPKYQKDHFVLLFVLLFIVTLFFWKGNALLEKGKVTGKRFGFLAFAWAGLLSLFFVFLFRCGVVCDSGFLSEYATEFLRGDYTELLGEYLHHYPFQLGMIAFLESVYCLFGVDNYLAFQILNVIAVMMIILMLQKITQELFEDERVLVWEEIFSLFMLPLYLFATFVYGDIIGWALGLGAVYCGIRFINSDKWRYLLAAGILFMPAIVIKSNVNILLVAFVIAMLLKMLQNRRWFILLWIVAIIFFSQTGVKGINTIYAQRAQIDGVWRGTPKIAWVAMGLQEADEEEHGCGWYNGYNWEIYEACGYDNELTTKACIEDIKKSLVRFADNPAEAVYFFYKKFVSQWNEPTFMSMITNEWYSRYTQNRSELADFIIYGNGRNLFYQFMNFYHLLIFVCGTIGCWLILKNWRLDRAYFVLNIFGGFLFHMIWEGKARYILGYFVMLLPMAAAGCWKMTNVIQKLMDKIRKKRHEMIG